MIVPRPKTFVLDPTTSIVHPSLCKPVNLFEALHPEVFMAPLKPALKIYGRRKAQVPKPKKVLPSLQSLSSLEVESESSTSGLMKAAKDRKRSHQYMRSGDGAPEGEFQPLDFTPLDKNPVTTHSTDRILLTMGTDGHSREHSHLPASSAPASLGSQTSRIIVSFNFSEE